MQLGGQAVVALWRRQIIWVWKRFWMPVCGTGWDGLGWGRGDDLSDGISQLADSHLRSSHSVLVRLVRLVTHPSATNFSKERSSHAWKGRCQRWSISEAENQWDRGILNRYCLKWFRVLEMLDKKIFGQGESEFWWRTIWWTIRRNLIEKKKNLAEEKK